MDGRVAVYFEPAAVIVVLVLLGQVLELRARSRTGAAIKSLLGLAPKTARRVDADGAERDVPLEHVQVGRSVCASGRRERIPVDGVVVEGRERRRRVDGDRRADSGGERSRATSVTGGTVNGTGTFVMRARARRLRHAACADCPNGERGAAIAGADSASGRHRFGLVRAGRRSSSRSSRSSSGRSSGRSRGSRMRSSTRSPC